MEKKNVYFGNSGKFLGQVKRQSYKDFKSLVASCFEVCFTLNITRKEFTELSKKDKQVRKRVPYLTASCFELPICERKKNKAGKVQLVFLDIDVDEETGFAPARPFVNHPVQLKKSLGDLNFVAHTTATSTPENPKMRLVVDCEPFDNKHYEKAVEYVAHLIGLPIRKYKFFAESKNFVQPMFRPTMFKGDDATLEHPVISKRTNGRKLKLNEFINYEPKQSFSNREKVKTFDDVSGNVLDFLKPHLPEITSDNVIEALEHIEPDCDYNEWLIVAASLRHQYPNELADEGFEIFHTWSMEGTKYQGEDDCRAKWNSLRQTTTDRTPTTIRTLLHMASQKGYKAYDVKEVCFDKTIEYLEQCPNFQELCNKGLGKIATTPLLSGTEEEALLNALKDIAAKQFNKKLSISTLKKDFKKLKIKINAKNPVKDDAPFWTNGIVFVSGRDKFFRHASGEWFSPQGANRLFGKYLLPSEEELIEQGLENNLAAQSRPVVEPTTYMINSASIPIVYDCMYNPLEPEETFIDFQDKKFINTFRMSHPEPTLKNSVKAGKMLLSHLRNMIIEEEYVIDIMDFLAYQVQNPGSKVHWVPVLQGAEGGGKTAILKIMEAVLGDDNVISVDTGALFSGYNEWAVRAQLVGLEEIRIEGKNAGYASDILKPLITNSPVSINEKFLSNRTVLNFSNYIAFSNHHNMVKLTPSSRRWFIIKTKQQTREDIPKPEYFESLFGFLCGEGASGLRHYLENWRISAGFLPKGSAKITKYFYEVLGDGTSDLEHTVKEAIRDNANPLIRKDMVSISAMQDMIEIYASPEVRRTATPQTLGKILRQMGYQRLCRSLIGDQRHVLWVKSGSAIITEDSAVKIAKVRYEENLAGLEDDDGLY